MQIPYGQNVFLVTEVYLRNGSVIINKKNVDFKNITSEFNPLRVLLYYYW